MVFTRDKLEGKWNKVLTYITIGTNNFQRAVGFYDAVFKVLGYTRLPAWTEGWAMWGEENNSDEGYRILKLYLQ